MPKPYDDRGAAERAMLYRRPSAAKQISSTSNNNNQQSTQIIKLLEQVRNRLTDIDKERTELWDAINDQNKTLSAIEDRSTSAEKTFISLENRLSRTELSEAPFVERLDEIERLAKSGGSENQEDLRKEILDRMEESDLQTARLIERIDEAMALQTRMTRRIDKVVQDKQRLNRKISLLEESIDATRNALTSKALVLLSDKDVIGQTSAPSIPLFHETEKEKNIFSDDEAEDSVRATSPFTPPPAKNHSSFAKQAVTASLFVIVAATAGWFISQNINSAQPDLGVVRFEEGQITRNSNTPSMQETTASSYQNTNIGFSNTPSQNYQRILNNPEDLNVFNEERIATALNNIEPSANTFEEPERNVALEQEQQPVETETQIEQQTNQIAVTSSPSIFESDESLPNNLKSLEVEAFKGNAEAQHDLAVIYTAGRTNVPQNFERAAYWFEKASDQGIANARYNLGVLYHQGLGVDQDLKEAINWYEKAAQLGHGEAQYNLGIAYIEGIGVDYDPARAAQYFEAAAATGVPEAAFNLGLIYENGLTGNAQPYEAILWYKTAADLGNPDANNAITQLAKNLNISTQEIERVVKDLKKPNADRSSQVTLQQNDLNISETVISQIQTQLMSFGLYPGPADGSYGPLTEDAIKLYQARHDMNVTGQASEELLVHMMTKNLRNSSIEIGSGE